MMKTRILKELKEAGDYISGQELCAKLQVSRTAVWKHIKSLREEGYQIDSVTNKGYRLSDCPDLLVPEEVQSNLKSRWLGQEMKFYETIGSTNLEVRRLAEEGAPHGLAVMTEEQTMGKGRRGRSWLGEPGCGIWMSFLLRPQIAVENSSMLTLIAALAVQKAIEEEANIHCQIKWPNDIIVNKKKICGILTELSAQMDELNYIVVKLSLEDTYNLLHGNITMRKAILKQPEYWDIVSGEEISLDTVEKKNINTIKMDLLPEEGACFEILTNQIKKFVQNFDNEFFKADDFVKSDAKLDTDERFEHFYKDITQITELLNYIISRSQTPQELLYDERMNTVTETVLTINAVEKTEQNNESFKITESYTENRADAA